MFKLEQKDGFGFYYLSDSDIEGWNTCNKIEPEHNIKVRDHLKHLNGMILKKRIKESIVSRLKVDNELVTSNNRNFAFKIVSGKIVETVEFELVHYIDEPDDESNDFNIYSGVVVKSLSSVFVNLKNKDSNMGFEMFFYYLIMDLQEVVWNLLPNNVDFYLELK